MWGMSITHWLVVVLMIVLLFGRNKISSLMEDIGKGIKNLKTGLKDIHEEENEKYLK